CSSLKPRNVSSNRVVARSAPRRSHLYRHRDLANVWADISSGIDKRLNQDLPLHVDERNNLVVCGADNSVRPRQYLAIQNRCLGVGTDDAVRARKKKWLEPIDENAAVRNILNAAEPDRAVVSCAIHALQRLSRLLFCDQIFAR